MGIPFLSAGEFYHYKSGGGEVFGLWLYRIGLKIPYLMEISHARRLRITIETHENHTNGDMHHTSVPHLLQLSISFCFLLSLSVTAASH